MGGLRLSATSLGRLGAVASVAVLALGAVGCGGDDESSAGGSDLSGMIRIDGSRVLTPLTEAVAEEFQHANPGVTVAVGSMGTGVGFEELCRRRIDIGDAAWVMDQKARGLCRDAGVAFVEVPIAAQALAALVNEENPVNCLTASQFEVIWDPNSEITNWDEIRDLEVKFDEKLDLFAPEPDTDTFDYFTEATDGVAGASRTDYTEVREDDAMLTGVAGALGGMGYLNFVAYVGNEDTAKALEVDGGKGCVAPSVETVQDGSYTPLSRPMRLDLSIEALKRPEVRAFVDYYLENVTDFAESVGLVPLSEEQLEESEAATKNLG